MKRISLLIGLCFLASLSFADMTYQERKAQMIKDLVKQDKAVYVYQDKNSKKNHFIPSGYMGDYGDIKITDNCTQNPKAGNTCLKVQYSSAATQNNMWAGVFWQSEANNWGERQGGWNLSKAKKLTFWARGEKGTEFISEFKFGGISGIYSDTDSSGIYDIELSKEWKQYTIDLKDCDMSLIIGGFCFALNLDNNPDGATFYLDEIKYEF
jgi:hypothetical protein